MEASGGRTAGPGTRVELPSTWTLLWLGPSDPDPPGAVILHRLSALGAATSCSMALRVGRIVPPAADRPATIALGAFPTLDELWTLYMMAAMATGQQPAPEWEALCRYAEDVRQGIWPDRVPVEHSLQAVYVAIAQAQLLRPEPRREAFVAEAFRLLAAILAQLQAGRRLLDDRLVAGTPEFERYVASLSADQSLYAEDLSRATRFWATVPPAGTSTGGERRVPLLSLARPTATQFKLWSRQDTGAPGKHGYPLLLVEQPEGRFVLSADPSSKLRVGWLAPQLPSSNAWYAGTAHDGTLISSPPGTKLSSAEVLRALKKPLKLEQVRKSRLSPRMRKMLGAGAAFVVSGVAVASRDAVLKWVERRWSGGGSQPSLSVRSEAPPSGTAVPGGTDAGRPNRP